MMNANEAAKKVNAYIENNANIVIAEIEKSICENADKGLTYINYRFESSTRAEVQDRVMTAIKEAGYTFCRIHGGFLQIFWSR